MSPRLAGEAEVRVLLWRRALGLVLLVMMGACGTDVSGSTGPEPTTLSEGHPPSEGDLTHLLSVYLGLGADDVSIEVVNRELTGAAYALYAVGPSEWGLAAFVEGDVGWQVSRLARMDLGSGSALGGRTPVLVQTLHASGTAAVAGLVQPDTTRVMVLGGKGLMFRTYYLSGSGTFVAIAEPGAQLRGYVGDCVAFAAPITSRDSAQPVLGESPKAPPALQVARRFVAWATEGDPRAVALIAAEGPEADGIVRELQGLFGAPPLEGAALDWGEAKVAAVGRHVGFDLGDGEHVLDVKVAQVDGRVVVESYTYLHRC